MIQILAFAIYLTIQIIVYLKEKKSASGDYLSVSSFIVGLFQAFMLFFIFALMFYGVKRDQMNMSSQSIIMLFIVEFAGMNVFLVMNGIYARNRPLKISVKAIAKELVQIFLPVFLLNLSLIFLSRFDFDQNSYIYMRIVFLYFYAFIFKVIYTLAGILLIFNLSQRGEDGISGNS